MRFLLVLAIIGLMTYAILDVARTEDPRRRLGLPAWLWVAVIIVTFGAGALIWLIVSRLPIATGAPSDGSATGYAPPRAPRRPARPLAPDDDPEFLAGLNRQSSIEPPKAPEPPAIEPPPANGPTKPTPRKKPKNPGEPDDPRTGPNPGDTEDRA